MYCILRIHYKRKNNPRAVRKVVLPDMCQTECEAVVMACAFADRRLDGRVLRMDVYVGGQVQITEARLLGVAKAVGQSAQGCHTLVFKATQW